VLVTEVVLVPGETQKLVTGPSGMHPMVETRAMWENSVTPRPVFCFCYI
jgi:hypothetical protein